MVGGELTLDSLELSYSATTGFYRAPVQAVANGGVLVIDDFGRQTCSPRDLLNRWIVPLESRVDFLTLQSGQKFELPFMTMIVFATNIQPGGSRRRSISPTYSVQDFCRESDHSGLQDDFRELLPGIRRDHGSGPRRPSPLRVLPSTEDCVARVPATRSHQAGVVARELLEQTSASDHGVD